MSDRPSVVVVIPAKDRAAVIGRALASVSAQTLPPDEVIVVDDGSTDDTAAIAREWGATVLVHRTSLGSGPARSTAIKASTAQWVAFLDSDDEWLPGHLEYVLAAAPGHVLVSSAGVDSNGRGRGNSTGRPIELTPRRCFVLENPVVTSGALADRRQLVEAGLFGAFRRAQDVDMWARLLERGSGVALPEATVVYHIPPGPQDDAGVARDRAGLAEVVASLSGRPWMTSSVRRSIQARQRWDDMRAALRKRELAGAVSSGTWIAAHPATWATLGQMLLIRRHGRRAAWSRVLESNPVPSTDG